MTSSDNRAHLLAATRRRADDTRARARTALRQLNHDGVPVTFATVAKAAVVSRALLYRDPELRSEIQRLRASDQTRSTRRPATQRASDASLRQRLDALLDEVRTLRSQNRDLQQRIASLLGEQRAAAARPPAPGRQIGPC
jgi:hypothetical protein